MDAQNEIDRILKEDGAVLTRRRKHNVWRLSTGKNFVESSTPGDFKSSLNNLARLKNFLSLNSQERGKAGARRERYKPIKDTPIRRKMVAAGLAEPIEDVLNKKIKALEFENSELEKALSELSSACWCRKLRFFKRVVNLLWGLRRADREADLVTTPEDKTSSAH